MRPARPSLAFQSVGIALQGSQQGLDLVGVEFHRLFGIQVKGVHALEHQGIVRDKGRLQTRGGGLDICIPGQNLADHRQTASRARNRTHHHGVGG